MIPVAAGWWLAVPAGVVVADGAASVTGSTTAEIVTASITAFSVIAASLVAGWLRRDTGSRPSAAEVTRLRRERDEARAERDEARDLNERLLDRYLDDKGQQ